MNICNTETAVANLISSLLNHGSLGICISDDLHRNLSVSVGIGVCYQACLYLESMSVNWQIKQTCLIFSRTKFKTYHDVIPISCLTEFPNVIQMAKVGETQWSPGEI